MPKVRKPPTNCSEPHGLTCPRCGCCDLRVVYVRHYPGGILQRVRRCRLCGRTVITQERKCEP